MDEKTFEEMMNNLKFDDILPEKKLINHTISLIQTKQRKKIINFILLMIFISFLYISSSIYLWVSVKLSMASYYYYIQILLTAFYTNLILIFLYFLNILNILKNSFKTKIRSIKGAISNGY